MTTFIRLLIGLKLLESKVYDFSYGVDNYSTGSTWFLNVTRIK
jgi:hypothetical protein